MIQARPYQIETGPALNTYWLEHPGSYPLVVMATGAGKTISMGLLVRHLFETVLSMDILVLAHRKELIGQTEAKIKLVWPEAPTGVYSAGLNRREVARITVASRDTLAPALVRMPSYRPRLVIVDEAHNISPKPASRYRVLLGELKARNPLLMVVGFTATPFRGSVGTIYGEDEFFGGIAHEVKMRQLLDEKYLLPLVPLKAANEAVIDTKQVKIVNGEFSQTQLREVTEHHHLVRAAVSQWHSEAYLKGRKHTLFFAVSVEHAKQIQAELKGYGIEAPLVTGTTSTGLRDEANRRMLNRELPALINVGVYTEGTDFPMIDCICNLRAIQSLKLYLQIMGRGMRTDEEGGKVDCLVLDYGECVERFGPVDIAQPAPKRIGKANKRTKVCTRCQTINSYYAFKCCSPDCDHEFDKMPHRTCEVCKEPCAPAVKVCPACGHLFVRHRHGASSTSLLSGDTHVGHYIVTGIRAYVQVSRKSKQDYLQLHYDTLDLACTYRSVLAIGYPERAGEHAERRWQTITRPGTPIPRTPSEAVEIIEHYGPAIWRPVHSIRVDHSSTRNDIIVIHYRDEQQGSAA